MTKNIAASVRARLANAAKATNRPFQELLQFYGLERFLFRFSQTTYRDRFILKGALMLRVWDAPISRPTRDIDLLGFTDNSLENLQEIVCAVCNTDVSARANGKTALLEISGPDAAHHRCGCFLE